MHVNGAFGIKLSTKLFPNSEVRKVENIIQTNYN